MALANTSPTEGVTQVLKDNSIIPNVGIRVTANVCVTRNDSHSDGIQDPTVTIITSLNAEFTESAAVQNNTRSIVGSGESCNVSLLDPSPLEDIFDQPIIRRSKKCTQLNNTSKFLQHITYERAEIDRTVILPYLGCTTKNEFLTVNYKKNVLIKSSKSWSYIQKKPSSMAKTSSYRSKSLCRPPTKAKVTDFSDQSSIFNESLKYSFTDFELSQFNNKTLNTPPISRYYCINNSHSGSQILFQDERSIKYRCSPLNDEINDEYSQLDIDLSRKKTFTDKSALYNNINGFDQELLKPPGFFCTKATRNVSILHRPQTRDKATSTTSLNNEEQSISDSIKGLLIPYISTGKRYPSELVLKLVTKKEFIESKPADDKGNDLKPELTHSSDTDLLVPVTNIKSQRKNRRKGNLFNKWFFKSKKKNNESGDFNNNSHDSLNREVYYPSIVEVHNKKKQKNPSKESDSFSYNNNSSFLIVKRKNK